MKAIRLKRSLIALSLAGTFLTALFGMMGSPAVWAAAIPWVGLENHTGLFNKVWNVAVGPTGNIYIVNNDNNGTSGVIEELPAGSTTWKDLTYNASGIWEFPQGIAVGPTGNVYVTVADGASSGVWELPAGSQTWQNINHGFDFAAGAPDGIAVDRSGDVFVTNGNYSSAANNEIVELPTGHTTWQNITHGTSFNNPVGLAVNNATGTLYVVNRGNNTVYKMVDGSQTALTTGIWSNITNGSTLFTNPRAIAVNRQGDVYVTNDVNGYNSVVEWVPGTTNRWEPVNNTNDVFNVPFGIAFNTSGSTLVVTNPYGSTVSEGVVMKTTAPVITTTQLPDGTFEEPYSQRIAVTQATSTDTMMMFGRAPFGLNVSGTTLLGDPTSTGTQHVVAAITNPAGLTDSQPLQLTVKPTAPSPPTLSLGATTPDSATFTWTPPGLPYGDGGTALTAYAVYAVYGSHQFVQTFSPSATGGTINGLTPGISYQASLRAVNTVGSSPSSNRINFSLTGPPSAPVLQGTPGNGRLMLQWTLPQNDGGSNIVTSAVYAVYGGHRWAQPVPSDSTKVTLNGLQNGTAYILTLKIINAAGYQATSNPIRLIPTAGTTVPSAPLLQGMVQNQAMTLSWTVPATDGGTPITAYAVYGTHPGGPTTVQTFGPNVHTTTLSGLTNGTSYSAFVRAINAVGDSSPSQAVTLTPTGPLLPPDLLAATAGNGSATLRWNPSPANHGTLGTTYAVYAGTQWMQTVSGLTTHTTITGLTNETSYAFTVRAVMEGRTSAASNTMIVTPHSPIAGPPVSFAPPTQNTTPTPSPSSPVQRSKPVVRITPHYVAIPNGLTTKAMFGFANGNGATVQFPVPVTQALTITVKRWPGVPIGLPNYRDLFGIIGITVQESNAPNTAIASLPTTDQILYTAYHVLPVGTLIMEWNPIHHQWVRVTTVTQPKTTQVELPIPVHSGVLYAFARP